LSILFLAINEEDLETCTNQSLFTRRVTDSNNGDNDQRCFNTKMCAGIQKHNTYLWPSMVQDT